MKNLYLIIVFTGLIPLIGLAQTKSNKYNGFEIYFIKDFKMNEKSYISFNKEQQKEFIKNNPKIEGLKSIPDTLCINYINMDKIQLCEKPFMREDDIKYYDSKSYTIILSNSGIEKVKEFKPNLFGTPFIIVANNKKVLSAWFTPSYSSQIIDRIFVTTNYISDHNDEKIKFKTFIYWLWYRPKKQH